MHIGASANRTCHGEGFSGPWGHAALEVREACLAFGGQVILDRLDFGLRIGEVVLLRGENGCGKTTLLNVMSGYLHPDAGSVVLRIEGCPVNVGRHSPERIARLGVGRLWQDLRLFPTMTVLENVLAATPDLSGEGVLVATLARRLVRRQENRAIATAMENLRSVRMADRASSSCDMLSLGQMKRVAIARLLQMKARVLLLDEPLSGLDARSTEALVSDLDRIRARRDKAILIVEHQHDRVAPVVDRTFRMTKGRIEPAEAGVDHA